MSRFTQTRHKTEDRDTPFAIRCRLCDRNHAVRLCPFYRERTPEDRLRVVLIHKYCSNCLSPLHRLEDCTSEERCRRCGEQHHTTLHITEAPSRAPLTDDAEDISDVLSLFMTEPTSSWAPLADVQAEEAVPPVETNALEPRRFRPPLQHERQMTNDRRRDGSGTRPLRPSRQRRQQRNAERALQRAPNAAFRSGRLPSATTVTMMTHAVVPIAPTAIVQIESGGRLHLVRALIDPCAPTSAIDAGLAADLRLQRSRTGHNPQCCLVLRGKYGAAERLTAQAAVVARHARMSPLTSVDAAVATAFQFMRLADPTFYQASPIRMTLGADLYARIMMCGTPATTINGLLAQATIFGLVVSGAHPQ